MFIYYKVSLKYLKGNKFEKTSLLRHLLCKLFQIWYHFEYTQLFSQSKLTIRNNHKKEKDYFLGFSAVKQSAFQ